MGIEDAGGAVDACAGTQWTKRAVITWIDNRLTNHILSKFPWPKPSTHDRSRSSSIPPCGSGGSRRRIDLGERSEERDEDNRLRVMRQRQDVARAHVLVARVQGAAAAVARHVDRHLLPPPTERCRVIGSVGHDARRLIISVNSMTVAFSGSMFGSSGPSLSLRHLRRMLYS